ncbi:hypothetical protein PQX77_019934 [Marasmius sp. AFHP31]|nr:hypothetical protein PQX77_019934 [Marasmius sp. AFHP31]
MISCCPFLFILSFPLKYSASLGIAKISPQAKHDDMVTLLSTHPEVDPTSFIFAAMPTSYPDSKDGMNIGTTEVEKQTGTMNLMFSKDDGYDMVFQLGILLTSKVRGIFAVDAYDTEALSASELQRRGEGPCGTIVIHEDVEPTCHFAAGGLCRGPTGSAGGSSVITAPDNLPPASTTPTTSTTSTALAIPTAPATPTVPISPATSTTPTATTPLAPGGRGGTPNDPPASNSAPASTLVTLSTPPTQEPSSIIRGSAQQVSKPTGAGLGSVQASDNRGFASMANSSQQHSQATSTGPGAMSPSRAPPQTRHSTGIGMIIGTVLGALLLLVLVLLVIFYYRRRRKHHQGKPPKPALNPTTGIRLCGWRKRHRNTEGPPQRDGDARAVSPYTLSGPGFGFVTGKHSLDVPASYVTPQEAQDHGTDTPENQGVDQPNMNVMNSRRPFLFILSFTLKHSASFGIAEIPPQAKRNDVVTLLSTYPEVDPTSFTFAAAPTSYPDSKDGVNIGTAEVEKQTGTMKSTFSKDDGYDTVFPLGSLFISNIRGIFAVDAYDTETRLASELQKRGDGCVPSGPVRTDVWIACQNGGGGDGLLGRPTGSAGGAEGPDTPDNSASALTTTPTTPTVPINPATSTTTTATTPLAPGGQDGTPNDPSHSPASNSAPVLTLAAASTPSTQDHSSIIRGSAQQVSKPTEAGLGSIQASGNRGPTSLADSSQQRPSATSTESSATPSSGTPPQTRHLDIGTIIGAVLGALALLILVLLVILCYRRRRKHHRDNTSEPAVKPTTVFGLCCWRKRDRDAEGPPLQDVSPCTLAGPGLGFVAEKRSLDVPVSDVALHETEDRGTHTPENRGVDQPTMDVYLRLDMMSRDLADLRQLMHDVRGVEESLPEYSSQ